MCWQASLFRVMRDFINETKQWRVSLCSLLSYYIIRVTGEMGDRGSRGPTARGPKGQPGPPGLPGE